MFLDTLILLIIRTLSPGKGKAWENAIEICKELAFQHAEVTFN
jgi:dedicator of cytokinesis protein 3